MTDTLWVTLSIMSSLAICYGHLKDRLIIFIAGFFGYFYGFSRIESDAMKAIAGFTWLILMVAVFNYINISAYRRRKDPKTLRIVIAFDLLIIGFTVCLSHGVWRALLFKVFN